jgi:hypothetical protein
MPSANKHALINSLYTDHKLSVELSGIVVMKNLPVLTSCHITVHPQQQMTAMHPKQQPALNPSEASLP